MAAANSMVTVMSRYPHPLHLSVYDPGAISARKGSMDMTVPFPKERITIAGAVNDRNYHKKDNVLLGMAGKTQVPADFWEEWQKQNENSPLVKGNVVFAEVTEARAEDKKAELSREKTGLEGIDPDAMPVSGVTKDNGKDK